MGEISPTTIFVAINDAPYTMTANRVSRKGRVFFGMKVSFVARL